MSFKPLQHFMSNIKNFFAFQKSFLVGHEDALQNIHNGSIQSSESSNIFKKHCIKSIQTCSLNKSVNPAPKQNYFLTASSNQRDNYTSMNLYEWIELNHYGHHPAPHFEHVIRDVRKYLYAF